MKLTNDIKTYMAEIGRKGGKNNANKRFKGLTKEQISGVMRAIRTGKKLTSLK